MTAWLAQPNSEVGSEDHRLAMDALNDAIDNAETCMPLMAGVLGALLSDLAEAAEMTPLEFWRPIAVRMSSRYPEGGA